MNTGKLLSRAALTPGEKGERDKIKLVQNWHLSHSTFSVMVSDLRYLGSEPLLDGAWSWVGTSKAGPGCSPPMSLLVGKAFLCISVCPWSIIVHGQSAAACVRHRVSSRGKFQGEEAACASLCTIPTCGESQQTWVLGRTRHCQEGAGRHCWLPVRPSADAPWSLPSSTSALLPRA